MVKTTPLAYKNKSPFLYTAYAHLYTTSLHARHIDHIDDEKSESNSPVDDDGTQISLDNITQNGNTVPSKKARPPAEWPHIWLFGSLAVNEENALSVTEGNCFRFDWGLGDWEKQQVNLEARYQFASCQFGNKILLHGGFRNYTKNHLLSSIQIFDMETRELISIDTDLALACHSGTYHKFSHSFIVFGGRSKQRLSGKCTRKTLHRFSLDTHQWERIELAKDSPEPEERYGHSLLLFGEHTLVLFGGKNQRDELLNDLWFFDLRSNTWERQDAVGDVPPGRSFHYALRHHHTMYILGGEEPEDVDDSNHPLYALDLKTRHWDALRLTGRLNTRRIGVSMTLFSNDLIGESIVAFGGMVKTKRSYRTAVDNKKVEVTVPLSNEMFHITSIPQYKLKRKLEALGDLGRGRPKKRQKITPRKLVAAHVDQEWILARIVKALDNGMYELEDAQAMTEDTEEEKTLEEPPKTYIVHGDNIARLSATLKDHIPLPQGTKVLALYPGTSCLYPGVIEDHGDESYYVLFEDDEEDGETPLREIGYKLLCPYQEGVDAAGNEDGE